MGGIAMNDVTFDICTGHVRRRWYDEDGFECEASDEYWYLVAGNARGENWEHDGAFRTEAEPRSALPAAQASFPEGEWRHAEPTYGSPAWGHEDEYALACFEADCYSEPRPNWA